MVGWKGANRNEVVQAIPGVVCFFDGVGQSVELNMSCPNVGEIDWPDDLFPRAMATGVRTIVKLPPVNYEDIFEQAIDAGVRMFHCCNTIPIPAGGVSGKPRKPVALQCIRDVCVRVQARGIDDLVIIGGGGDHGASGDR